MRVGRIDRKSGAFFHARPTLLFVAAYMATMTSHEVAHAVMAYQLGFGSTIFQLWVSPEAADATPRQIATIAATGPIFSLVMGAVGWIGYRLWPVGRPSLGFLMLGLISTYAFLGPLVATALAAFMFFCGKRLVRHAAPDASRLQAVLGTVVGPWVIGTALARDRRQPAYAIGDADVGLVIAALVIVRALTGGVRLTP